MDSISITVDKLNADDINDLVCEGVIIPERYKNNLTMLLAKATTIYFTFGNNYLANETNLIAATLSVEPIPNATEFKKLVKEHMDKLKPKFNGLSPESFHEVAVENKPEGANAYVLDVRTSGSLITYIQVRDVSTLIWANERWWALADGEDIGTNLISLETAEDKMFKRAIEAFETSSFAKMPDHPVDYEAGLRSALKVFKEFYIV